MKYTEYNGSPYAIHTSYGNNHTKSQHLLKKYLKFFKVSYFLHQLFGTASGKDVSPHALVLRKCVNLYISSGLSLLDLPQVYAWHRPLVIIMTARCPISTQSSFDMQ